MRWQARAGSARDRGDHGSARCDRRVRLRARRTRRRRDDPHVRAALRHPGGIGHGHGRRDCSAAISRAARNVRTTASCRVRCRPIRRRASSSCAWYPTVCSSAERRRCYGRSRSTPDRARHGDTRMPPSRMVHGSTLTAGRRPTRWTLAGRRAPMLSGSRIRELRSPMLRTLFRLGAVALTILVSTSGVSADTMFPAVGGRGDASFNDRCPAHQYLIGLAGRAGTYIDQAQIICAPMLANGTHGTKYLGPSRGGSGGTPLEFSCAGDSVVSGVTLAMTKNDGHVAWIVLTCVSLRSGSQNKVVFGTECIHSRLESVYRPTLPSRRVSERVQRAFRQRRERFGPGLRRSLRLSRPKHPGAAGSGQTDQNHGKAEPRLPARICLARSVAKRSRLRYAITTHACSRAKCRGSDARQSNGSYVRGEHLRIGVCLARGVRRRCRLRHAGRTGCRKERKRASAAADSEMTRAQRTCHDARNGAVVRWALPPLTRLRSANLLRGMRRSSRTTGRKDR